MKTANRKIRRAGIYLAISTFLIFLFQNCTNPAPIFRSSSAMSSGNGELYTGLRPLKSGDPVPYSPTDGDLQLNNTYYRLIPGYTCEANGSLQASYAGLITVGSGGPVLRLNQCSSITAPLDTYIKSPYVPELLAHSTGIYEKRTAPDPAQNSERKILWCRNPNSTVDGTDVVIKKINSHVVSGQSISIDLMSATLDPRLTLTRASTGSYIDSAGVLKTAAANTPRFDYDATTGQALGLLLEETRTNLLRYSEDFTRSEWSELVTQTPTIVVNDEFAPDGQKVAERIYNVRDDSRVVFQTVNAGSAAGGRTFSFSVWVKGTIAGNHPVTMSFGERSASWPNNIVIGNDIRGTYPKWTRLELNGMIGTTGATDSNVAVFIGSCTERGLNCDPMSFAGSDFHIWGAQFEEGASPSSYIKTIAATATRAGDQLVFNDLSWYSPTEGTIVAEVRPGKQGLNTQPILIGSTATGDGFDVSQSTTGLLAYRIKAGGAVVASRTDFGPPSANNSLRIGLALKASDLAVAVNGSLEDKNQSVPGPSPLTSLSFGSSSKGSLNGHVQRFTYWPARISDNDLILSTQPNGASGVLYTARVIIGASSGGQYQKREVLEFPALRGSTLSFGSNNYYFRLNLGAATNIGTPNNTTAQLSAIIDGTMVDLSLICTEDE